MTYSETRFERDLSNEADGTGWFVGVIVALALLTIGYLVFSATPPTHYAASSTVFVDLENGHGSGVHIGDGLILTAAHVASEGATVKLRLDDGTSRDATVLWASKASDVALLRTGPDGLASSPLSCAPPVIGQAVTAYGSPLEVEFIHTYGHIVGPAVKRGPWDAVATVDMEIIPGMSGGSIKNDRGEVVGIAVGLATLPMGISSSATGIGFMVPGQNICALLGRH